MRARRLRRRSSRLLVALAAAALPLLYRLYMGLVWRTSRIEDAGMARLHQVVARHGGAVALVWHDEVLGAAWAYPHQGFRPHTLASVSNAGEIVARLLERCGYRVFRGGASRGRTRRRPGVWRRMIEHMREREGILWGLAVDGSHGPRHRLKRGPLVLARAGGRPLVLVRTAYARALRLPTWDRTLLPLPFNRIRSAMRGPYFVPDDAGRPGMERFRRALEAELLDLTVESDVALGRRRTAQRVPPACAGPRFR